MWNEIAISLGALVNLGVAEVDGPYFYEQTIEIPAGQSIIETDFEWNAVTLFHPDGKYLPKMWYKHNAGHWNPWHVGEEEEHEQPSILDVLYAGESKTELFIKSEGTTRVVAHFYNTKIEGENEVAQSNFEALNDDSGDNPFYGVPDFVARPQYISRDEWGADESLRVWKPGNGVFTRGQLPETNDVDPKYRPKIVSHRNKNGQTLRWPIQENQVIKKFIVHHTGEYVDEKRNPRELMRAIYYYHTVTRGWGDIGYNYVIDKQGNIYEGRAGGVTTVGTHTAYYNVGTVGISLMGNFQHEIPTDKQIKVLTLTLADLSDRFSLNPVGRSKWLGTLTDNITGHRHVARPGHGTACPGENLVTLLPDIRQEANKLAKRIGQERKTNNTRRISKQSKFAPNLYQRTPEAPTQNPIELAKLIKLTYLKRGQQTNLEFEVKNQSNVVWPIGEKFYVDKIPDGIRMTSFRSTQSISPGQSGVFRAKIWVDSTPNGLYNLELQPLILAVNDLDFERVNFTFPIQVSGSTDFATKKLTTVKTTKVNSNDYTPTSPEKIQAITQTSTLNDGPEVKIKLSYFNANFVRLRANEQMQVWSNNTFVTNVAKDTEIRVIPTNTNRTFKLITPEREWQLVNPQFKTTGIITLLNYNRGLSNTAPYNEFRQQINVFSNGGKDFYLVNQLPLELYLRGLAEQPKTEPTEKKHAIHVLARSYAYVYAGDRRKFGTINYDLEDSPETSQLYLGYGWERYHSEQTALLEKTRGEVITYNGTPVIGPYFTQSSGASSSKWISQYPWTVGRKLPYDEGLEPKGHGVGLSGNSAHQLADAGKNYKEILDYFYTGIDTKKIY